ncbi:YczE/YyaS/YitT family protein [Huintestinicola sp.]|uniref:YczE/YyaS/YitT family protein n=1 Tax=Huintestinicola sp. TaxID=2981661 RepID=UPI003D7D52A0
MGEKMSRRELLKRYGLFIISLFISALGVAVTKRGELGVSPISSAANVMSMKFTALSLSSWLIIWNLILIAGQIALLRKNFKLIQLLQAPLSFLFGWFTDIGMRIASLLPVSGYISRLMAVVCGTVILGFGISLSVAANVIMNSGEAFVKAVSDVSGKEFGNVKIIFDISNVTFAAVLSLALFDFKIVGLREGTVIAALFTGVCVKFFTRLFKETLDRVLSDNTQKRNEINAK